MFYMLFSKKIILVKNKRLSGIENTLLIDKTNIYKNND